MYSMSDDEVNNVPPLCCCVYYVSWLWFIPWEDSFTAEVYRDGYTLTNRLEWRAACRLQYNPQNCPCNILVSIPNMNRKPPVTICPPIQLCTVFGLKQSYACYILMRLGWTCQCLSTFGETCSWRIQFWYVFSQITISYHDSVR